MVEAKKQDLFKAKGGALLLRSAAEQKGGNGRREYKVRYVKVGKIRGKGNRLVNVELPAEPLKAALRAGLFDNRASFLDHAGFFDYPSLKNLVGVTLNSAWNELDQSVDGVIRLYDSPGANLLADILDDMLGDMDKGGPAPDVGLSMVFWPKWERKVNDEDPLRLSEIRHIEVSGLCVRTGC